MFSEFFAAFAADRDASLGSLNPFVFPERGLRIPRHGEHYKRRWKECFPLCLITFRFTIDLVPQFGVLSNAALVPVQDFIVWSVASLDERRLGSFAVPFIQGSFNPLPKRWPLA